LKITTAAEMREIDRVTTEKFGVPSLTLMENAGSAVARWVIAKYPKAWRFTIFCGKGNNGGDGFVAARKLGDQGRRATVVLLCDPSELKGDAAEMFKLMRLDPLVVKSAGELRGDQVVLALKGEVIIDAILGTGFRPPVTGLYAEAIKVVNASRKPVFAVDIPSGVDADSFNPGDELRARADHIVTFTAPRPAHVFAGLTRGETVVSPIGSPDEAIHTALNMQVITPRDFAVLLADRTPDGHKGTYGHAMVVGGSFGKSGAVAMAGMSVLRSGAGLSTIATPRSVVPMVASFTPEIMTEPLLETDLGTISPEAGEQMERLLEGKDVVALGPGIGRYPATVDFVRKFVERCKAPLVIDADGLNAFESCTERLSGAKRPLVLTPHPGEMSRLTGLSTAEVQKDRIGVARKFAAEHECIVVLKGHRTLIALPDGTVWVNVTGNPGMATGGTGDVLTGMVAGMMAQTQDVAMAVRAAVYLHGLAGDAAREKVGEASLVAGDLIAYLPEAFKRAKMALMIKGFVFHG
jgi:ADP-dependent NAD(P)H-hydrate dehydratase / NAD(P)H-hydrate epimerase